MMLHEPRLIRRSLVLVDDEFIVGTDKESLSKALP